MTRYVRVTLASAALFAAACSTESPTGTILPSSNAVMSQSFATVPLGFTSTENSFDASTAEGTGPWFPGGPMGGMGRELGPGLGHGFGPMIGGGLGGDFIGGPGLSRGFGHGPLGDPFFDHDGDDANCTFSAATGRVACDPVTHGGLTITRSVAFTTAAGAAQSAFDSLTTNTINTKIQVAGTITRRDSSTTTVTNSSDRTVSGLAHGSTQHTVNGTAGGHEQTQGTNRQGTFVAVRDVADSTRGLIIPVSDTGHTYPTAGTIVRTMLATITYTGQTAQTSSRREVITYNGSATAQMVITQDGTTRTCSVPLPFGRPTCQ